PRRLSSRALAEYLTFGYVPEPLSIFAEAKKLPPAHLLTWDRVHGARTAPYWSPVPSETLQISERAAVSELRDLLKDAVRCHLESDVPIGAFLSGGID